MVDSWFAITNLVLRLRPLSQVVIGCTSQATLDYHMRDSCNVSIYPTRACSCVCVEKQGVEYRKQQIFFC